MSDGFAPIAIKLVRIGNRFVGLVSSTGRRGHYQMVVDVPGFIISANVYLGVVASSGSEAMMAEAAMEDITISSTPTAVTSDLDGGASPPAEVQ